MGLFGALGGKFKVVEGCLELPSINDSFSRECQPNTGSAMSLVECLGLLGIFVTEKQTILNHF